MSEWTAIVTPRGRPGLMTPCGNVVAECETEDDAADLARLLNRAESLVSAVEALRNLKPLRL